MTDANIFDLRDVIADAVPERLEVETWFDKEGSRELTELEGKVANEKDEAKAQELLDEYIAKLKEFKEKRYVFHLVEVPRERKEEIQLEALNKVPYRRDAFGRDDVTQEYKRGLFLKKLIWMAYIEKIVNPAGAVQERPGMEVINRILGYAPNAVVDRVDAGIEKLDKESSLLRASQMDPDFLSRP